MAKADAIDFSVATDEGRPVIAVRGDWTLDTIGAVDRALRGLGLGADPAILDVSGLGRIDTAGAFVIDRTLRRDCQDQAPLELRGRHEIAEQLILQVRQSREDCPVDLSRNVPVVDMLARLGRGFVSGVSDGLGTLSFVGHTLTVCMKLLFNPRRLRGKATVSVMEEAGLDAIPIVVFLTFFVGMVVAFIGASTLRQFGEGAVQLVVQLVGFSVMREFGVILTAIILAGRTNSAFTAQIGAMRMRQEVDAMRVMGLDPMEVLVAPRVIAMLVMTPILTFLATLAGISGGLVVSWLALDIPPVLFLADLKSTVDISNFWVGMSKAPFFAIVVALIGCRQGLLVGGSVQSLGQSTTSSVVQAIFTIIVLDALFALFYMVLDI